MTDSTTTTLRSAAVVVVGTELVLGMRTDTNGPEVARALATHGFSPRTIVAAPDDLAYLTGRLRELVSAHDVVIVTGGLGPTHDDITREAAAHALGLRLHSDSGLSAVLSVLAHSHREAGSAEQVLRQALIIEGAQVLHPTNGTAPGQIIPTEHGALVLLPGPPGEMRPMLAEALAPYARSSHVPPPITIGCVGMRESDVQLQAQNALSTYSGITLTVLGRPSLVDVVLIADGADATSMGAATRDVADALGADCYATDGATLAEVVVRQATARAMTIALAESCTGGLISAALTDVAGASAVLSGAVVAYSNEAKSGLLGVEPDLIATHGAVSAECAGQMAVGARTRFCTDFSVATTGIAGPAGGTLDKPVGLVWFACDGTDGVTTISRQFAGDRALVRARATVFALDLLRRTLIRTS